MYFLIRRKAARADERLISSASVPIVSSVLAYAALEKVSPLGGAF
jgi:hypothetical protein